jgi:Fe-S-cluster containining protein
MKCLGCNKCEDLPIMYLPKEAESIAKKLNINPKELGKQSKKINCYYIGRFDPDCKYFIENRCEIHRLRPLDCRSFPILPYYQKGMKFFLTYFCPAAESIDNAFINKTIRMWKKASPSKEWLKEYSKKFNCLKKFPYRKIKALR